MSHSALLPFTCFTKRCFLSFALKMLMEIILGFGTFSGCSSLFQIYKYSFNEYKNYIYKLLKSNKFKFPIKITIYIEFLVYDSTYITIYIDQQDNVDITHITNYQKYFKNNEVLYQDILNVIKEFKDYYDTRKIEMLMLHLNKNLYVNRQNYKIKMNMLNY